MIRTDSCSRCGATSRCNATRSPAWSPCRRPGPGTLAPARIRRPRLRATSMTSTRYANVRRWPKTSSGARLAKLMNRRKYLLSQYTGALGGWLCW